MKKFYVFSFLFFLSHSLLAQDYYGYKWFADPYFGQSVSKVEHKEELDNYEASDLSGAGQNWGLRLGLRISDELIFGIDYNEFKKFKESYNRKNDPVEDAYVEYTMRLTSIFFLKDYENFNAWTGIILGLKFSNVSHHELTTRDIPLAEFRNQQSLLGVKFGVARRISTWSSLNLDLSYVRNKKIKDILIVNLGLGFPVHF